MLYALLSRTFHSVSSSISQTVRSTDIDPKMPISLSLGLPGTGVAPTHRYVCLRRAPFFALQKRRTQNRPPHGTGRLPVSCDEKDSFFFRPVSVFLWGWVFCASLSVPLKRCCVLPLHQPPAPFFRLGQEKGAGTWKTGAWARGTWWQRALSLLSKFG